MLKISRKNLSNYNFIIFHVYVIYVILFSYYKVTEHLIYNFLAIKIKTWQTIRFIDYIVKPARKQSKIVHDMKIPVAKYRRDYWINAHTGVAR